MLGVVIGAEAVEDPCALTAKTATAITTNSLENMEVVFFFKGVLGGL